MRSTFTPANLDAERRRMFRAAGVDVVALVRTAVAVTQRCLDSPDGEAALRAADQVYKLAGLSASRARRQPTVTECVVTFQAFAEPAPSRRTGIPTAGPDDPSRL